MVPTDRFVAEHSFHVRYAETDAMGIVHHASYIVYFEEARSHYSRVRGVDYAEFEKSGYFLTVAEVHARYQSPAHYAEVLTARCWIEDLKSRSLVFGYEIVNAETQAVL
ncbi:MAG: acyl-CoA thioesterase, partial [Anaerolineae bacterium]|nr:acyl-CoA thioesterase [Anaerolineae bacterium]